MLKWCRRELVSGIMCFSQRIAFFRYTSWQCVREQAGLFLKNVALLGQMYGSLLRTLRNFNNTAVKADNAASLLSQKVSDWKADVQLGT